MKTKSRLHRNQRLNSSCNSKGSFDKKKKKKVFCLKHDWLAKEEKKKLAFFEGQKLDPSLPHIFAVILHSYQSYLLFPCFSASCQVGASTSAVGDLALRRGSRPSPPQQIRIHLRRKRTCQIETGFHYKSPVTQTTWEVARKRHTLYCVLAGVIWTG